MLNGHDHCLGHFFLNDTNFILSGAAGYPQAGDCNNGTALGPYALFLGANNFTGEWREPQLLRVIYADCVTLPAANGFVTLDISEQLVNVEYYARDMAFEDGDLYPVDCDLKPSYNFQITQHAT